MEHGNEHDERWEENTALVQSFWDRKQLWCITVRIWHHNDAELENHVVRLISWAVELFCVICHIPWASVYTNVVKCLGLLVRSTKMMSCSSCISFVGLLGMGRISCKLFSGQLGNHRHWLSGRGSIVCDLSGGWAAFVPLQFLLWSGVDSSVVVT